MGHRSINYKSLRLPEKALLFPLEKAYGEIEAQKSHTMCYVIKDIWGLNLSSASY